jgi:hypothetical protein
MGSKIMADEIIPPVKPPMLGSLPLWVQAVSIVGFPILVAGFYMAKDAGLIPSITTANAEVLAKIVAQHENMYQPLAESLRLQREICRSVAKNPESLRACNQGE